MKRYYSKSLFINKYFDDRKDRDWRPLEEFPKELWKLRLDKGGLIGRKGRVISYGDTRKYNENDIVGFDESGNLLLNGYHIPKHNDGEIKDSQYDNKDENYGIGYRYIRNCRCYPFSMKFNDESDPNNQYEFNYLKQEFEEVFNTDKIEFYSLYLIKIKLGKLAKKLEVDYTSISFELGYKSLICRIPTGPDTIIIEFSTEIEYDYCDQTKTYMSGYQEVVEFFTNNSSQLNH